MPIPKLEHTETVDPVLRVQRAVSRARSESELIYTFAREISAISPVQEYVELAVVEGRQDAFVISDYILINDPELSPESVMRHNKWPTSLDRETIHTGGLLGGILDGESPKIIKGVAPEHDERLVGMIDGPRDALAVPVFFEGVVTQWAVLFSTPGGTLDHSDVRVACSVLNMLSRGAYQLRLQGQVEQMRDAEQRKLEEVARIQRTLLPQRLPEDERLEFAAHYTPSDYAGGDYYDFREFPNGAIGFVVADVAGHGPGAAVVMAMLRSAMFLEKSMGLADDNVVQNMNRFIYEGVSDGVFVTAVFVRITPETGLVEYANAGHCPPRLLRADGTVEVIDQNATLPLGVIDHIETDGGYLQLEPGDAIVLFTDGINEAFNDQFEMYDYTRLDTLLRGLPSACDAKTIITRIIEDVNAHTGGKPADDDRCIVVVRYAP